MKRVPFEELHGVLARVLVAEGFEEEGAESCALLFAEASRDGVASHGLNRFPRFVRMIRNGTVDPRAEAVLSSAAAALERWDGRKGPGNLNARRCMARAIRLAGEYGIGCVALANTNHWMRAGSYGWQAAEAGMIGLCWTNTLPNLPPWGSDRPALGNNPLVVAVPRPPGHVVLDMAMSQFSYGSLESYARRGEELPVAGGFDEHGTLSRDPAAILASGRPLPIGFWKGSGLALVLDMLAATLACGAATHSIDPDPDRESDLSQVFIAMQGGGPQIAEAILSSLPAQAGMRYPGERVIRDRELNLREGVPVDPEIWSWVSAPAEQRRDVIP